MNKVTFRNKTYLYKKVSIQAAMKMMFVIVLAIAGTSCIKATQSCSQEIVANPCIEISSVDTNFVCTQEYDPVCGCNDVTYSNVCVAANNGVQHWAEGECCP